jgi:hypothetical protein
VLFGDPPQHPNELPVSNSNITYFLCQYYVDIIIFIQLKSRLAGSVNDTIGRTRCHGFAYLTATINLSSKPYKNGVTISGATSLFTFPKKVKRGGGPADRTQASRSFEDRAHHFIFFLQGRSSARAGRNNRYG